MRRDERVTDEMVEAGAKKLYEMRHLTRWEHLGGREQDIYRVEVRAVLRTVSTVAPATPPAISTAAPPCGIADPSTRDCENMKEVGGGMDGERYRCDVCGKGYFLDYEEMK